MPVLTGQNDGTLDVALWDDALGHYWGLVRVDAGFVGRPGVANANPRRTGRFTSPDMLGWPGRGGVTGNRGCCRTNWDHLGPNALTCHLRAGFDAFLTLPV